MKKFLIITILFTGICSHAISQQVNLTAVYDYNNSAVKLNWNMINSNVRTSYLLLRSSDGVTWTEAAKDRMLRKYTDDDIYFFNDRFYSGGKNYYRLKIVDGYNNTIALSPIVAVNTKGTVGTATQPTASIQAVTGKQNNPPSQIYIPQNTSSWVMYPNPATDLLKLTYKGPSELKGVVYVQIQDMTGKVVIKFRSGSKYRNIEIPISNLQRGTYVIQLSVQNELMMNQKFIKQ